MIPDAEFFPQATPEIESHLPEDINRIEAMQLGMISKRGRQMNYDHTFATIDNSLVYSVISNPVGDSLKVHLRQLTEDALPVDTWVTILWSDEYRSSISHVKATRSTQVGSPSVYRNSSYDVARDRHKFLLARPSNSLSLREVSKTIKTVHGLLVKTQPRIQR